MKKGLLNQKKIDKHTSVFEEPNRRVCGDFRTNEDLADSIALHLCKEGVSPEPVFEPTCGKGRFIIAAIKRFKNKKNSWHRDLLSFNYGK